MYKPTKFDKEIFGELDFTLIDRSLTGNVVYDKEPNMTVAFEYSSSDSSFEISLSAEKKGTEAASFTVNTRVAIEQHSEEEKGHHYPHLQLVNFASDEELLRTGKLHITLLVESKKELEECCNGFVYTIGHILDLITKIFKTEINLKEFFFNTEHDVLSKYLDNFHELIYRSFKQNMLTYQDEEIKLIEYKGKKSEDDLDTTDHFKIMRIVLNLKVLNPILLKPLLRLIVDIPEIKERHPAMKIEEFETCLLGKTPKELAHYNKAEFIKEFIGK